MTASFCGTALGENVPVNIKCGTAPGGNVPVNSPGEWDLMSPSLFLCDHRSQISASFMVASFLGMIWMMLFVIMHRAKRRFHVSYRSYKIFRKRCRKGGI